MHIFKEPTLTPNEAAKMFGVRVDRVYHWMRSGKLKTFRLGGRYHIPQSAIEEMIRIALGASE